MERSFSIWLLTRKEELAAVTVPWGLIKAAFSLAICSMELGRMPLSLDTMSLPNQSQEVFMLLDLKHHNP